MNGLVLDASVALCWCFENQMNPYAEAVDVAGRSGTAMQVPPVWALEIGHALLRAEQLGRLSGDDVDRWAAFFQGGVIGRDPLGADLALSAILQAARRHRLSTYDASYLELAARLGWPLATLDHDLRRAAKSAGVPLFEPTP